MRRRNLLLGQVSDGRAQHTREEGHPPKPSPLPLTPLTVPAVTEDEPLSRQSPEETAWDSPLQADSGSYSVWKE